jgi:serine/threonine protein kinase
MPTNTKHENYNVNNWDLSACKEIVSLKHKNIENISRWFYSGELFYFFSKKYTGTIESIIQNKTQFIKHDIKKLFIDFHQALVFLKEKNICHRNINPKNLRFNGRKGFIGGFLEIQLVGTVYTPVYGIFLKSRRYLLQEYKQEEICGFLEDVPVQPFPSDDMWNLVAIYVYTYYGFDPFNPKSLLYPSLEVDLNTLQGQCSDITLDKHVSIYGRELMGILTREYETYDYENILKIFMHNDDAHINGEKRQRDIY